VSDWSCKWSWVIMFARFPQRSRSAKYIDAPVRRFICLQTAVFQQHSLVLGHFILAKTPKNGIFTPAYRQFLTKVYAVCRRLLLCPSQMGRYDCAEASA
jgi:hypothetical protein